MSPSIRRLVLSSIAAVAVLGAVVLVIYLQTVSWTETEASRAGVLWAFRELDATPALHRPQILSELQPDVAMPLSLLDVDALRERLGHVPSPGELVFDRTGLLQQWVFTTFSDGQGGLAAGPGHPINPYQQFPIGLVLLIVLGPLLVVMVVARLTAQLRKVEQASDALGAGELSARVDNPSGPSSELAESFNRMAVRVEQLVRERDELLQAVSHELGSPLARLRVQFELLTEEEDVPHKGPVGQRLEAIAAQLDELAQLVEDLSRWVQSDESAQRPETFDPVAPLQDLAELARYHETANQAVEIDVVAPAEAELVADPRLYQRAVDNLLRNAMRYAKHRVRVELLEETDGVTVTIEDDGPGIPEEDRQRVLEPYARLGSDRDRRSGGAGLGLAIVNRILRGHGGAVRIGQSELGGAKVWTVWPRECLPRN